MNKNNLIYGIHAVQTAVTRTPQSVLEVWFDANRADKRMVEIQNQVRKNGLILHEVPRQELDHLLPGVNHQGVIAHCSMPSVLTEAELFSLVDHLIIHDWPLKLILDGVQDPHNLGACVRSADGVGVDAVIIPKDKSVGITPVVAKVASGALNNVPVVQVTNLARTMEQLKKAGIWIVGMDDKGDQTLFQVDLTSPVAIALGAEGSGLRRLTKEKCDFLVKLPMLGVVESLNVSVASGICLYEALRQRTYA